MRPDDLAGFWRAYPHTLAERVSNRTWKPYEYLRRVSIYCARAIAKGRARILINMPPRHGKSELSSIYTPLWYLQNFQRNEDNPDDPGAKILLASYSGDLAMTFGRRVRNEIVAPGSGLSITLAPDSKSAARFDVINTQSQRWVGKMETMGVGGSMTGKGANLLIMDDLYKDHIQAQSQSARDNVVEWWRFVSRTRLETNGSIIGVMTRWHEDDIINYILKNSPDKWEVFKFPAIAEEGDPLGRRPGEALNPKLFNEYDLNGIKEEVGSYAWAGLYQQDPVPRQGGMFKRHWWRWWQADDKFPFKRVIQFWDCAQKPGLTNDFSVCATWGEGELGYYLIDLFQAKMEQPDLEKAIVNNYERMKGRGLRVTAVVIEDKSAGSGAIQSTRRNTKIPVIAFDPGQRDKEVRAGAATPTVQSGRCFLPEGQSFVEEFVLEHEKFPKAKHDDQVDTTSMMVEYFQTTPASEPRMRELG